MSSTPKLFYGDSARAEAEAFSLAEMYHSISPPIDLQTLSLSEVREALRSLDEGFLSLKTGSIVVGPMDQIRPRTSDAFLKTLEEPPKRLQIILWATDLGMVSKTVVSRCHLIPTAPKQSSSSSIQGLRSAIAADALFQVIEELKKLAGNEREVLEQLLEQVPVQRRSEVWPVFRKPLTYTKVTRADALFVILTLRGRL